jgi:hypothetical protein
MASLNFTTMAAAAQSTNPTVPSMIPQAAAHTVCAKIRAIDTLTREVTHQQTQLPGGMSVPMTHIVGLVRRC